MPQKPVRKARPRRSSLHKTGSVNRWDDVADRFLDDKRRQGCSVSTLTSYTYYLTGPRIEVFRSDHGIDIIEDFTADVVATFDAELRDAGLGAESRSSYMRTLKTFLRWARDHGMDTDDMTHVRGPKLAIREPETISLRQELELVKAAASPRDTFLIKFMLRTGLRRSEVTAVTLDDLSDDPDGMVLHVRQGEGSNDRMVPLDTRIDLKFSREVQSYLRNVRPADTENRALFLSTRRDSAGNWNALGSESVKTIFRRLSERVDFTVYAHMMRHTYASRLIAAGIPTIAVQQAMGYANARMLQRYVHFNASSLQAAMR